MPLRRLEAVFRSKQRFFRLRPLPTDTEDGRASERYRLAGLGAIAALFSRITAMVVMVLTIRWVAPAFGAERFGVWATFYSLATTLSFLDLGVGHALINQIAHAIASGDSRKITTVVTGGLGWLVALGLAAAAVLGAAAAFIPWMSFFKLSTPAIADEARAAAEVFSALFGVSLVSNGLLRILMGQQRAYEAQLISIGSTLLSGIMVFCALRQGIRVGTLLVAGFGTQCATTMIVVLALLWFRGLLDVRIIWRSMRQQGSAVLASGSLFFFLQIGTMIGWGGDALLVASMSGALDVAAFAVAQRLFQFASQPVAVMNAALWPAYADAHAIADRAFLRATFRRSLTLSLVLGLGLSSLLLIASPWIVPYWTKKSIPVPGMLLAAFAVWTCVEAGGNALGIYLNGVGIARAQVIVFGSFCVVAIPAKLWGVTHGGPTGLLIATTLSYVATVVLLYSTIFRRVITAPMRQAG